MSYITDAENVSGNKIKVESREKRNKREMESERKRNRDDWRCT